MLNKLDKLINICDKTQTNYNTIKRHMSLKDKYLH